MYSADDDELEDPPLTPEEDAALTILLAAIPSVPAQSQ